MLPAITRRQFASALAGAAIVRGATEPLLIESHLHLFDPKRFPYHSNAVYRPEPKTIAEYVKFARETQIDHAVIVHPEPYQDDHRYLLHCFEHEPSSGFFKGTCLFDPLSEFTAARMRELTKLAPGRIVALRIHATAPASEYPRNTGPIRDRDLSSTEMRQTWRAASDLGLAIQMHMTPVYVTGVHKLASEFRDTTVIIDHLARAGEGKPDQYESVLQLAEFPRVVMKLSGIRYSSKQDHPHADVAPLVQRTLATFGADRMMWGSLGTSIDEFTKAQQVFDTVLPGISPSDRNKLRGGTAVRLFKWE
jgi:predicted TIM-barrel fold metal-dependent hydrolase